MVTLKKELIKANKITKRLDKILISLINKYENNKINDEKFHEEFLKNKDNKIIIPILKIDRFIPLSY